jgi:hypothetical protein
LKVEKLYFREPIGTISAALVIPAQTMSVLESLEIIRPTRKVSGRGYTLTVVWAAWSVFELFVWVTGFFYWAWLLKQMSETTEANRWVYLGHCAYLLGFALLTPVAFRQIAAYWAAARNPLLEVYVDRYWRLSIRYHLFQSVVWGALAVSLDASPKKTAFCLIFPLFFAFLDLAAWQSSPRWEKAE